MPKKVKKKSHTSTPPRLKRSLPMQTDRGLSIDKSSPGSGSCATDETVEGLSSPSILQTNLYQDYKGAMPGGIGQDQSLSRLSLWLDNIEGKTLSRGCSPDPDTTPRPLRILKGRKSFQRLDLGMTYAPSTPPTSQPHQNLLTGLPHKEVQEKPAQFSPLTRSFFGLRLSSPKALLPHPAAASSRVSQQSIQRVEPLRATNRQLSNDNTSHLTCSELDLSRQFTEASVSTSASSNSFLALSRVSPWSWINRRQRSASDEPKLRTHSFYIDKEPVRVMSVVHPNTIYESGYRVDADFTTESTTSNASPTTEFHRAASVGPGYYPIGRRLSSVKAPGPLTTRSATTANIERRASNKTEATKPRMLSKVLCTVQDMSPVSGSRLAENSVSDISKKTSTTIAITHGEFQRTRETGSRKSKVPDASGAIETIKTRGNFRGRTALGSIRKRFGSGAAKAVTTPEETPHQTAEADSTSSCEGRKWEPPPILRVHVNMHSESMREHIDGGELWVCIEIEGRATNLASQSSHKNWHGREPLGLDIAIILDLSAYASPSTFEETKATAKYIVNSLCSIDKVSLTAFTSIQSTPGVETKYPLSELTQTNKEQLLGFIDGLFSQEQRQGTIRSDIKAIVTAAMEDLQASSEQKLSRSPDSSRTAHVILLTSSLRNGDMPKELLLPNQNRIKVHFLGMGPLVHLQERPLRGGWMLNSGISPVSRVKSDSSESGNNINSSQGSPTLPQILNSLRQGVELGELSNIRIRLKPGDRCKIIEIFGETSFEKLVPGEKRVLLVKVRVGRYNPASAPETSANTPERTGQATPRKSSFGSSTFSLGAPKHSPKRGSRGNVSEYKLVERQLAAALGVIETKALVVSVRYGHDFFGPDTIIVAKQTLRLQRFDGDGNWSSSIHTISQKSKEVKGNAVKAQSERKFGSVPFNSESHANALHKSETDETAEFVRAMLARKVAEIAIGNAEETPKKALKAIEESGIRGKGVHAVASELEWRIKIKDEEEETKRILRDIDVGAIGSRVKRGFVLRESLTGDGQSMTATQTEFHTNPRFDPDSDELWFSRNFHEINTHRSQQGVQSTGKQKQRARFRSCSVVIHPVSVFNRSSPLVSESHDIDGPFADHIHTSNILNQSTSSFHRASHRQDHIDEAGRIWKELTESKMGLRKDVRPGRYRGSNTPASSKHSRHNSMDFIRERYDDRKMDLLDRGTLTLCSHGAVRDKQKGRRRRIGRQPLKKRSVNTEGGFKMSELRLADGNINSMVSSDSGAYVIGPRNENSISGQNDEQEGIDVLGLDDDDVFIEQRLRPTTGMAAVDTESSTAPDHRNRDTMQSLITLRDVKETDFSPWAC
ncbi:hypothetical protein BDZ91DRAFT_786562 [Kalaharituber pfeilii]|nr:hypothetical protein BDZ91DRAFT_786562 [Kalaharituber pfeilii]